MFGETTFEKVLFVELVMPLNNRLHTWLYGAAPAEDCFKFNMNIFQ